MIKQWYTAREFAEFALEGMPRTERSFQRMALNKEWKNRCRNAIGGGKEYHIDNLPENAKISLIERVVGEERLLQMESEADSYQLKQERGRAKFTEEERTTARIIIVSLFDNFRASMAMGITDAEKPFLDLYVTEGKKDNSHIIPAWIFEIYPKFSIPTLRLWRANRKTGAIKSKYGNRKGKGVIERAENGELSQFIIALITKQTHITAGNVRDACRLEFGETVTVIDAKTGNESQKDLPNVRTFERFIQKWKEENKGLFLKLTDPDTFKNKFQPAFGSASAGINDLNQVWEIDASPVDVMCEDGRWNMYAIIDVYSRRAIFSVSRTAATEASLSLVRKAILEWGIPQTLKTDNGSDFVSYRFQNALISLGIAQELCAPFTPEGKPHVERVFKTLQHDLMPMLPGYIGHSVADRKKIEGTKAFSARLGEDKKEIFGTELSSSELQEYIDNWAQHKYGDKIHSVIKESPNNKARNWKGAIKTVQNERALDILLAPIASGNGYRQVTKQGIRSEGVKFTSVELALYIGQKVFVRHNPDDLGRIYVFEEENGTFICEAINPESLGISRQESAEAAKKAQKAYIAPRLKEIRGVQRKITPRDMVDGIIQSKIDQAENVISFRPEEEHTSPAIEAALSALDEYTPVAETPLTPDQKEAHQKLVDEMQTPAPQIIELDSRDSRIQRAIRLKNRLEEGDRISSDDQSWLETYQTTSEWSAHALIQEDFGSDWFNKKGEY